MAFTSTATTALTAPTDGTLRVGWDLTIRRETEGSWTAYDFVDFKLNQNEDVPDTLSVELLNTALDFLQDTRVEERARVRLTATIGSETEIKFDGYITAVKAQDEKFSIDCEDMSGLANECTCKVYLSPDRVAVVAETAGTAIQITEIASALGSSYGFPLGTSEAFSAADQRRSWAATAVQLWDGATISSATQYPMETYSIDYSSGAVKILDKDHASKTYYARNVYALKETAAGGTNVDVMRLIEQAWATAQPIVAVDVSTDTFSITGDFTDLWAPGDKFEVQNSTANDNAYTIAAIAFNTPNTEITVLNALDGTVDGAIVHESDYRSPRFTAAQLDLTDTGIDIDREIVFPLPGTGARIVELTSFIRESLGVHIKTYWDHANGVLKGRLETQHGSAALDVAAVDVSDGTVSVAGDYTDVWNDGGWITIADSTGNDGTYQIDSVVFSTPNTVVTVTGLSDATADGTVTFIGNWKMYNPVSIAHVRDDKELYTSVVVRGKKTLPLNIATLLSNSESKITAGNWFSWDGFNVGDDDSFANVIPYAYDGNANHAAAAHNLNATETTVPGSNYSAGSTKYSEWYNFWKLTLDKVREIQRIRVIMPPSRNPNASIGDNRIEAGGDAVGFWPGVKILVSEDDTNYFLASPLIDGIHKPGDEINAEGKDILWPRAKYIYILCRAYKHGDENQSDPGIGIGELGIYVDIYYEVVREISGWDADHYYRYTSSKTLPITGVNTSSETFSVAGDYTSTFVAGYPFAVSGSASQVNDGVWVTASSVYSAPDTVITVTGNITNGTVQGDVYTDIEPLYAPNMFQRFGMRHKTIDIEVGDEFDEFLASDVALRNLMEYVRSFYTVTYQSVTDPRVKLYDTVIIDDDWNGDVPGIFVTGVTHTMDSTTVVGVNYLAASIEDSL